jgi:hypothetical protein
MASRNIPSPVSCVRCPGREDMLMFPWASAKGKGVVDKWLRPQGSDEILKCVLSVSLQDSSEAKPTCLEWEPHVKASIPCTSSHDLGPPSKEKAETQFFILRLFIIIVFPTIPDISEAACLWYFYLALYSPCEHYLSKIFSVLFCLQCSCEGLKPALTAMRSKHLL